jgi:hypothetical protein
MWVLLIGNPIEGFTITGTFHSTEDANHYGERYITSQLEWWIMEINPAKWSDKIAEEEPTPKQNERPDIAALEHYVRTGEKIQ